MDIKTVLLEGRLIQLNGEWVLEALDKKLYRVSDLCEPFKKCEVRLIIAEIPEVKALEEAFHKAFEEE